MLQAKSHWLITGGAGFIGSHLARTLALEGQQVTVLDDLSSGSLQNLQPLQDKISFVAGDICNLPTLLTAFEGVDYVLHHAALSSVVESMDRPQDTTRINILGTQNVLKAARQCGVKRVVFASSAAVYGTLPGFPYKETSPIDCQSPYAWSKHAGAELCQLYTRVYQLETIILRYFNVFGPRQNPHSPYAAVIAKFMQLARENKPLSIDWDGQQSRDFVNVADVVQANLLVATQGNPGEIYNVASGETHTLLELASIIEQISGRTLAREMHPKRPGDAHESSANIEKIRALGFVPKISLEMGLREMWKERKEP